MKFPNLSIRNFLTIAHAELDLADRGLLALQGVNKDDTSAESNGAGKSSAPDALCWCLYGETARGVTGDAVVNRKNKKDCEVAVVIADEHMEYRIVRFRKHKTGKNMVTVSQRDTTTGVGMDLSKGTDRETQEVINRIMGCSLDVFKGAIYAGQEAMPDLPGMTDKYLKLLVEEAAGVEELADAHKEASKRALAVERDLITAQTHLKALQQRSTDDHAALAEANTQVAAFESGRKDRARTTLEPMKVEQVAIDSKRLHLDSLADEAALRHNIAALQAELAGHAGEQTELAKLMRAEREAGDVLTRFRSTTDLLKGSHDKAKTDLAAVDGQVGVPCNSCGRPYAEHDLDKLRELRTAGLENARKTLVETIGMYKTAGVKHGEAVAALTAYKAGMTDVSATVAKLKGLQDDLGVIETLNAQIATHLRAIDACKAAAKVKLTEPNPWTKVQEQRATAYEKGVLEILHTDKTVAELEAKDRLYKDAVAVFGPAGVRAHVLDTVTPYLNARTGEYLGALSDGNIHATWSTLSTNAKGDLKEKFNIDVTHDEGGDEFKALSGGEKRKVRLAANLALQDMKASRATKPIKLWIGDEIDHALDGPALERLMSILERKAREAGTVLVISHNALSDWIDNVITVTKENKVSTMSGATQRGM